MLSDRGPSGSIDSARDPSRCEHLHRLNPCHCDWWTWRRGYDAQGVRSRRGPIAGNARRIAGGVGPLKREPAGWVIVGVTPIDVWATEAPAAGAGAVVGADKRDGDGTAAGTWVTSGIVAIIAQRVRIVRIGRACRLLYSARVVGACSASARWRSAVPRV